MTLHQILSLTLPLGNQINEKLQKYLAAGGQDPQTPCIHGFILIVTRGLASDPRWLLLSFHNICKLTLYLLIIKEGCVHGIQLKKRLV